MCEVCQWLKRGPHVELLNVRAQIADDGVIEIHTDWLIAPRPSSPAATRTESCLELRTNSSELADAVGVNSPTASA